MKIAIIGGGAAGFFAAIACAEANRAAQVTIFERGKDVLEKVRISGGGRCNVTTSVFEPRELIKNYPRGGRELLGPFTQFGPTEACEWFEKRGVRLKTEADGRIFPTTDNSETIAQCLLEAAKKARVQVKTATRVEHFEPKKSDDGQIVGWQIQLAGETTPCLFEKIMIAAGSSAAVWRSLEKLGHRIVAPVPSLFTFNVKDARLEGLLGLSVPRARAVVEGEKMESEGPLLITHWGLSGPCILKLSAFGARLFQAKNYRFSIKINWIWPKTAADALAEFSKMKSENGKKQVATNALFGLPSRLWVRLSEAALGFKNEKNESPRWADLDKKRLEKLAAELADCRFEVNGKSIFKEEFVTAGGVDLREVNFKTFESRLFSGLFMAGEILDIDAVTGGFNFQAAWTGGFLAGRAMGT